MKKIAGVFLNLFLACGGNQKTAQQSHDDVLHCPKEVSGWVEEGIAKKRFQSVAIAIYHDGKESFCEFVEIDKRTKTKPLRHGAYQIGSVTKTFSALLLADAVERRELSLDNSLGKLLGREELGERKLSPAVAAITLKELVTHRSGLPRMPANADLREKPEEFGAHPYDSYKQSHLLDAIAAIDTLAAKEFAYSNFGFALLGNVLSRPLPS